MRITKLLLLTLVVLKFSILTAYGQGCAEPKSDEGVSVFGFLQPQFETKLKPDGAATSFSFNRARIGVTGSVPYDFVYYAVIEASAFKDSIPFLLDAFVSYQRFKWAKISIGQFKSPFTLEMSTPCSDLNTIYRSQGVNNLVSPDRDLGIMISGSLLKNDLLKYSLAFTNGTGKGKWDNNNAKTFHGRLEVAPVSFLKVGGGVQRGTHPPFADTITTDDVRFRWAADMQLNFRNFSLIGEYVYGKDKGSYVVGGGCGGTPTVMSGDLKRSGMYITAMYKTPWNLQPVVRYEKWNTDMTKDNASEQHIVYGANYWFNDWTRVQLNYVYKAEEKLEVKNDEIVLQIQIKF